MATTKFTQAIVQNITPGAKRQRIKDSVTTGLTLSVEPSGRKTWLVDYRRQDGKRSYYTVGRADLFTVAEAREKAKEFLARVKLGEYVRISKSENKTDEEAGFTLGEYLEAHYFPWALANRKNGTGTVRRISVNFKFLWNVRIKDIAPANIERWRVERIRNVKAATINKDLNALRAALNWGVKNGLAENNPLINMGRLQERDSQEKVRYLFPDERERLIAALDSCSAYLKAMVIVSLNTGIRRGALFSLQWSDVDLDKKILTLSGEYAKNSKLNYVPINNAALSAFQEWKNKTQGNGLVFPSPITGEVLDTCKTAWRNLMRAAGIKDFRWHDMRHDFASQLVMKGVDLNTVRELLGHSDIRMTLRYAHLAPGVKTKAVAALDE
jgi:integrase